MPKLELAWVTLQSKTSVTPLGVFSCGATSGEAVFTLGKRDYRAGGVCPQKHADKFTILAKSSPKLQRNAQCAMEKSAAAPKKQAARSWSDKGRGGKRGLGMVLGSGVAKSFAVSGGASGGFTRLAVAILAQLVSQLTIGPRLQSDFIHLHQGRDWLQAVSTLLISSRKRNTTHINFPCSSIGGAVDCNYASNALTSELHDLHAATAKYTANYKRCHLPLPSPLKHTGYGPIVIKPHLACTWG